ncbi:MAG TPA: N-acetyltransferase [Mycobacterium sp.]|nr:N-acetyltransferase [Mycobacterium sp.]
MIAPSVYSVAPSAPPQPGSPNVRAATAADDQFVDDLQELAFGPGRFARTAYRVRERFPIDPSLSLIAEVDGTACGSVWMTPISVGDVDGYMLGPLATHPNFRKRGAGKMLAREVTRLALSRGTGSFVLLVGDQDYYCPLGWQVTTPGAVEFPGPVDPTRVLLYSEDKTLAKRIRGPIAAFGARKRA